MTVTRCLSPLQGYIIIHPPFSILHCLRRLLISPSFRPSSRNLLRVFRSRSRVKPAMRSNSSLLTLHSSLNTLNPKTLIFKILHSSLFTLNFKDSSLFITGVGTPAYAVSPLWGSLKFFTLHYGGLRTPPILCRPCGAH